MHLWIDRDGSATWTFNEPTIESLECLITEGLLLFRIRVDEYVFSCEQWISGSWQSVEFVGKRCS